jgi:hypothetical protein
MGDVIKILLTIQIISRIKEPKILKIPAKYRIIILIYHAEGISNSESETNRIRSNQLFCDLFIDSIKRNCV